MYVPCVCLLQLLSEMKSLPSHKSCVSFCFTHIKLHIRINTYRLDFLSKVISSDFSDWSVVEIDDIINKSNTMI